MCIEIASDLFVSLLLPVEMSCQTDLLGYN